MVQSVQIIQEGLFMKLRAPKGFTFFIAFVLAGLGIASKYVHIDFVSDYSFWFVVAGYGVLFLGNIFRGM